MSEVRLQKFLSAAGIASRRKAETLITEGRVSVNGKQCTVLGTKVDPQKDKVVVDGKRVRQSAPIYLAMNKPRATLCTESDPEGRERVHDLLPPGLPRVFTVGRLDFDTEGLLLFTNDGDLAKALTDRKNAVPRIYRVKIQGEHDPHLLRRFNQGVRLDDGHRTKPSPTELLERTRTNAWYEVILTEGMNRQIHRMAEACGRRVLKIRRDAFGPIRLDALRVGHVRHLNSGEVRDLIAAAGLSQSRRDEHFRDQAREKRRAKKKPREKR